MTAKVIALQIKAGIQRDGTQFASPTYTDGQWVRFQNGLPKKINGYNGIFLNASGVSRGMVMTSTGGLNYVVSGYSLGLQQWATNTNSGSGFGPIPYSIFGAVVAVNITSVGILYSVNGTYTSVVLSGGTGTGALATVVVTLGLIVSVTITNGGTGYLANDILSIPSLGGVGSGAKVNVNATTYFATTPNNLWQFDIGYDSTGNAATNLVAHPGQNLTNIDSTVNTRPLVGIFTGTVLTAVGVFPASVTTSNTVSAITSPSTIASVGAGLSVSGTNIPLGTTVTSVTTANSTLTNVLVSSTLGTFTCNPTSGLFVGQSISVGGLLSYTALGSPLVTSSQGTFSCTAVNPGSLYVGQPVLISGSSAGIFLSNVAVANTTGRITFNTTTGIFKGMTIHTAGTLTGNEVGINTNTTYYVVDTDGSTFAVLAYYLNGTPLTTSGTTTTGLTFLADVTTGITSGTTYFIVATNGTSTFTLGSSAGSSVLNTNIFSLNGLTVSVPLAIGLTSGISYFVIATNGASTFSLSSTLGGSALTTIINPTSNLSLITGAFYKINISNPATGSGVITATFDNNISVSGGVVILHPYLFVYGNNGLIQNSSAGDFTNWTSADSNSNNVSTGKVVKGLPLRGGTTSPAGLFWTLDSVVRVTYSPSTVNGISFFWRYDLITSQSSIMSSQSIIEYDGIFYWAGVDRFLSYNGTVQEIPNSQNQNWFFDNLNYVQRQKVWVTKVPRWGEIWFFYPRGSATECTDAIIYNVRDKSWYDAGMAPGAARSAGTFSEVFRKPIWADNVANTQGTYTLWQHETGTDQIYTTQVDAVQSFFETNTLGQQVGLVGSQQQAGDNVFTRLERIEPDFIQTGSMNVYVTGKGYADGTDETSTPYVFAPDTLKIDMREQRREMRLRFESNTQNGDYYMGKVLLSIETGDTRSTGNP